MSQAQSIGAQERWMTCQRIAEVLGCGKTHVHDKLYSKLKQTGLLDDVVGGDDAAVQTVKAWPEFEDVSVRMYVPEQKGTVAPLDKLNIAKWFISKMGGVDKAHKAIDAYSKLAEDLA